MKIEQGGIKTAGVLAVSSSSLATLDHSLSYPSPTIDCGAGFEHGRCYRELLRAEKSCALFLASAAIGCTHGG